MASAIASVEMLSEAFGNQAIAEAIERCMITTVVNGVAEETTPAARLLLVE